MKRFIAVVGCLVFVGCGVVPEGELGESRDALSARNSELTSLLERYEPTTTKAYATETDKLVADLEAFAWANPKFKGDLDAFLGSQDRDLVITEVFQQVPPQPESGNEKCRRSYLVCQLLQRRL